MYWTTTRSCVGSKIYAILGVGGETHDLAGTVCYCTSFLFDNGESVNKNKCPRGCSSLGSAGISVYICFHPSAVTGTISDTTLP